MLTIKEVAEKFGVHEQTVYRWVYSGKLKAIKVGGLLRVTEEQLKEFVEVKK
ncbi:hypothetical protein LCGC14_3161080 [marine sediment metagenome]|uniref:HTH merR-type domain-containing protein n=1 Tax=marine sediment metagenome TaxID=412755 RepID=A0A0F8YFR4_9ZZZZ